AIIKSRIGVGAFTDLYRIGLGMKFMCGGRQAFGSYLAGVDKADIGTAADKEKTLVVGSKRQLIGQVKRDLHIAHFQAPLVVNRVGGQGRQGIVGMTVSTSLGNIGKRRLEVEILDAGRGLQDKPQLKTAAGIIKGLRRRIPARNMIGFQYFRGMYST